MKLNNKGFTVVELIASFVFSSILAISLFAVIINYRDKEEDSSIQTDLLAFKSQITIDIEKDIERNGLKEINYCTDSRGNRIARCIVLSFLKGDPKTFEIKEEGKVETMEGLNGSDTSFSYTVPYLSYGGIRYDIPDAANINVRSDYLLEMTTVNDGLESNTPLYKIRVILVHNDLDADIDISIVADGSINFTDTMTNPYKTFAIGDRVSVILNSSEQKEFRVIKASGGYDGKVTLLYDDDYSLATLPLTAFNNSKSNGNQYEGSSIKGEIDVLGSRWANVDEVRLITAEEVGYIVSSSPTFKQLDAPPLSLSSAPAWLVSTNYYTMTSRLVSEDENKDMYVWYVNGTDKRVDQTYVDAKYQLRPVIVVDKRYIANQ